MILLINYQRCALCSHALRFLIGLLKKILRIISIQINFVHPFERMLNEKPFCDLTITRRLFLNDSFLEC